LWSPMKNHKNVFLTGVDPNLLSRDQVVSPVCLSVNKSQVNNYQVNKNQVNLILNVKNSSRKPLSQAQLQKIIEKIIVKKETTLKSKEVTIVPTEQTTTLPITGENRPYLQRNLSLSDILKKEYSEKLLKSEVCLQRNTTMDPCDLFQSVSCDFDQLLNDIYNDVQTNDDLFLDEVLNELSSETPCKESFVFDQLQDGLGSPDLSELPLEDFNTVESYLEASSNLFTETDFKEFDVNQDYVSPPLTDSASSSDIEDILSDLNSPYDLDQNENEFDKLVNTLFDSDFMHDNAISANDNLMNCQKDSFVEEIEVSPGLEVCRKRKLTDTSDNECSTAKYVKHHEQIVPLNLKENETEKEAVRRIKNNEASKITRAKRKQKQEDLFKQEAELLKSNAQMKINIEVMQKEAEILRKVLVSKLSSIKS